MVGRNTWQKNKGYSMTQPTNIPCDFTRLTNVALRAVAELSEAEPDSIEELRLKLRLDNIRFAMERGIYE